MNNYYLILKGKPKGPYSIERMRGMWANKSIAPGTKCQKEGESATRPIEQFSEITSAQSKASVPFAPKSAAAGQKTKAGSAAEDRMPGRPVGLSVPNWKYIIPAGVALLLVVVIIIFVFASGDSESTGNSSSPVAGGKSLAPRKRPPPPKQAVFTIEILDPSETLPGVTTAELYLKVTSTVYQDVQLMAPLNVGGSRGHERFVIHSPFIHHGQKDETLVFELLDDDELSDAQVDVLSGAVGTAGYILYRAGQSYAVTQGMVLPDEGAEVSRVLARNGSRVALSHFFVGSNFDSFGSAEYVVEEIPPASARDATRLTVVDRTLTGAKAKLHIRIHYIPAPANIP